MIAGQYIRLCKLSEHNPGVLPVDHWLKAVLQSDVVVGRPIEATRYERAPRDGESGPQVRLGAYLSSPVVGIVERAGGWDIETQNSHWRLTVES